MNRIQKSKARLSELKRLKEPFYSIFDLIALYIEMKKVTFSADTTEQYTEFVPEEIFTTKPNLASKQAVSTILGLVWPNSASSFRVEPHDLLLLDNNLDRPDESLLEWFNYVNKKMTTYMDDPRSGFIVALEEALSEYFNYGTASIGVFENKDARYDTVIDFVSWDIKQTYIDENSKKIVDTIYSTFYWPVTKIVDKYGIDNVSSAIADSYEKGSFNDKYKIVVAIEPNPEFDPLKEGNRYMPISILHFEEASGKILKSSGDYEFPVPTARLRKIQGMVWGKGIGFDILPDVIELNAIYESIPINIERHINPPYAILDDGSFGNCDIDRSPNGWNVLSVSSRLAGTNPIVQLGDVKEPSAAYTLSQDLIQSITQHYMIDRLLDLNNETEMTLGEAQIRNGIRSQSLTGPIARLIRELFVPLLDRTFNILLRKNEFGYLSGQETLNQNIKRIPQIVEDAILNNKSLYKLSFISPAARMATSEEAAGLQYILGLIGEIAGVQAEIMDLFDIDKMITRLASLRGVTVDILNSVEDVNQIRQQRLAVQQQMAQLEMNREVSEISRNKAQAQATLNNINQI
jgi:hypothetical protein